VVSRVCVCASNAIESPTFGWTTLVPTGTSVPSL
jgi:hypothetical protein